MRSEEDLTSRAREYESVQVDVGTVGWDDKEAHFERGDPKGGPGQRHTLVYVTLFRGKDPSTSVSVGTAQGRKIVCCLNMLAGHRIPKKGARVYVAVPHGMEESPGASCIIAAIEDEHTDNLENGDQVISASEGAARIVVRNDGTIAFIATTDNTPDGKVIVFSIGPKGLKYTSPFGSESFDETGWHLKTKAGPRIDMGGLSIPGLPGALTGAFTGYCTIKAPTIKMDGGSIFLGAGSVFQPALFAPVVPLPDIHQPPLPVVPPLDPRPIIQSTTVWMAAV